MTFLEIEAFLNIVQFGSFSAAAEKLYVTQPALGRRIRALKKEPGKMKNPGSIYLRKQRAMRPCRHAFRTAAPCYLLLLRFQIFIFSAEAISSSLN